MSFGNKRKEEEALTLASSCQITNSDKPIKLKACDKHMIKSLTGLRFYAAFLVFISHMYHFNYFGIQNPSLVLVISSLGHLGVDVFFVLSGFVLFVNYRPTPNHPLNFRKFYLARFARVYPVFCVTTLLAIPMELFSKVKTEFWLPLISNLSVTQCLFKSSCGTFNDVSWTISNEAFFYLAFPFCIYFLKTSKQFLIYFLIAFSYFTFLFIMNMDSFYSGPHFPLNRLIEFTTGILAGCIFSHKKELCGNITNTRNGILAIIFSISMLILMPLLLTGVPIEKNLYFLAYLPFSFLLVLMLALVEKRGQALHWFSSPIIILGGEISYSFYLIHNLILRYLKHGLQILFHLDIRFCPLGGQLGIATVALILSLASSLILYRYVETPCRRIIRQFL